MKNNTKNGGQKPITAILFVMIACVFIIFSNPFVETALADECGLSECVLMSKEILRPVKVTADAGGPYIGHEGGGIFVNASGSCI